MDGLFSFFSLFIYFLEISVSKSPMLQCRKVDSLVIAYLKIFKSLLMPLYPDISIRWKIACVSAGSVGPFVIHIHRLIQGRYGPYSTITCISVNLSSLLKLFIKIHRDYNRYPLRIFQYFRYHYTVTITFTYSDSITFITQVKHGLREMHYEYFAI